MHGKWQRLITTVELSVAAKTFDAELLRFFLGHPALLIPCAKRFRRP